MWLKRHLVDAHLIISIDSVCLHRIDLIFSFFSFLLFSCYYCLLLGLQAIIILLINHLLYKTPEHSDKSPSQLPENQGEIIECSKVCSTNKVQRYSICHHLRPEQVANSYILEPGSNLFLVCLPKNDFHQNCSRLIFCWSANSNHFITVLHWL